MAKSRQRGHKAIWKGVGMERMVSNEEIMNAFVMPHHKSAYRVCSCCSYDETGILTYDAIAPNTWIVIAPNSLNLILNLHHNRHHQRYTKLRLD